MGRSAILHQKTMGFIFKTPLISTTCSNCRRVVLCSYFIGSHERLKRTSTEALISSFDSSINDA